MTPTNKLVGKRLRKHRRLIGLSQTEVARKLQLKSSSIISRWERGVAMPTAENVICLSILYKTLANELLYDVARESQQRLFPNDKQQSTAIGKSGNDP